MVFGYPVTKENVPSQNDLHVNLSVICQYGTSFNLLFCFRTKSLTNIFGDFINLFYRLFFDSFI